MAEPSDLVLTCQPARTGRTLAFDYALASQAGVEVYLLDMLPTQTPNGGDMRLDRAAGATVWEEEGRLVILLGAPPLPPDRKVPLRLIPLGTPLPPGGRIEHRLELPLPLAEQNPYYPDLALRDYSPAEVKEVRFAVQVLRAGREGFGMAPAGEGEGLVRVWTRQTIADLETVSCSLPVRGLEVLHRPGAFPRPKL